MMKKITKMNNRKVTKIKGGIKVTSRKSKRVGKPMKKMSMKMKMSKKMKMKK